MLALLENPVFAHTAPVVGIKNDKGITDVPIGQVNRPLRHSLVISLRQLPREPLLNDVGLGTFCLLLHALCPLRVSLSLSSFLFAHNPFPLLDAFILYQNVRIYRIRLDNHTKRRYDSWYNYIVLFVFGVG